MLIQTLQRQKTENGSLILHPVKALSCKWVVLSSDPSVSRCPGVTVSVGVDDPPAASVGCESWSNGLTRRLLPQCHRLTEERDEAQRQLKHIKRGEFLPAYFSFMFF